MNETVFYAATSADGYLSGPDGDMTWAEKYLASGEDYGFAQLMSRSTAVIMGRATFEFEVEAGVSGERLLPTYVLTHIPELYQSSKQENLHFVGGDIAEVMALVRAHHPGQIFVMGGANVVEQLIEAGQLDVLRIFRSPDVLGAGTALFNSDAWQANFAVESTRTFDSGLVETVYSKVAL
jgi:dihydrofolate reductase